MAFLGVLPERLALFQPQPRQDVGINDAHAWRLNPRHRHIYNKLDVALAQGLLAAPCGAAPGLFGVADETPVFVKPITNLSGMSLGARAMPAGEMPAEAGSFWCELLQGEQSSTDCLMLQGKVMWFAHTRAADERNRQRPVYWQIGVQLPELEASIRTFLESQLEGYTGLCNVEMIDGKVIEAHLRGSNGFFDFYGAAFMASWVELLDQQRWASPGAVDSGVVYSVFGEAVAKDWPQLQERFAREYPQMSVQRDDHVPDRIAIIRGPSLQQARAIKQELLQAVLK